MLPSFWAPARADAQGIGFQGGGTVDPEQFYVGTHIELPIVPDQFFFRPAIEGGFSDNLTVGSINFDFLYQFPLEGTPWSIYQGGGPALIIVRFSEQNDLGGGLNFIFGFKHEAGFFSEFTVGSRSSPNLKFGAGFTIHY